VLDLLCIAPLESCPRFMWRAGTRVAFAGFILTARRLLFVIRAARRPHILLALPPRSYREGMAI